MFSIAPNVNVQALVNSIADQLDAPIWSALIQFKRMVNVAPNVVHRFAIVLVIKKVKMCCFSAIIVVVTLNMAKTFGPNHAFIVLVQMEKWRVNLGLKHDFFEGY